MYELRKGVREAKRGNVGKSVETRCAPTDKHWSQLHRSDRPVSSLNGSWIIDSILITWLPSIQSRDRYTLNFVSCFLYAFFIFFVFFFSANWRVESKQKSLLRGTLSKLGARQYTAVPLRHALLYSRFCSELDDTRGKLLLISIFSSTIIIISYHYCHFLH